MSTATARRDLAEIRAELARLATPDNPTLQAIRQDPARILMAAGMTPDSWQTVLLRSSSARVLMNAARQTGKSSVAAALALREALLRPRSLVLLLSPSQRQSGELFTDKVLRLYQDLGAPVPRANPRDNALRLALANGSRIVALPGNEATIRGYSGARLLIIDEASRVPDVLYRSVRPMLATSKGALVALTTPWGKQGWFYEEWIGRNPWHRVQVTAGQCARIPAEFLAEEEAALGPVFYPQEYSCIFSDSMDSFFRQEDIDAALAAGRTLQPLFATGV